MPAIRKEHQETTTEYRKTIRAASNGDPASIALAVLTGASYREAEATLAAVGYSDDEGIEHEIKTFRKAMRGYGLRMVLVRPEAIIINYPHTHRTLQNVTTHHMDRFPQAFERVSPMIIYAADHLAAIKDGKLHDWTRGHAYHVKCLWRVFEVH